MNLYEITEKNGVVEKRFFLVALGLTTVACAAFETTKNQITNIRLVGPIRHIYSAIKLGENK